MCPPPPAFRAGSLAPLVTISGVVASVLAKKTAMCCVSSYVFPVTAILSTSILGSPSKYPRRKTCLLIVEREASTSLDDRNCPQNRDQLSTSPLKVSTFTLGSFTERETKPVGSGVVSCVGILMFNRVVERDCFLYPG